MRQDVSYYYSLTKSRIGFPLIPQSVTLNVMAVTCSLRYLTEVSIAVGSTTSKWLQLDPYCLRQTVAKRI